MAGLGLVSQFGWLDLIVIDLPGHFNLERRQKNGLTYMVIIHQLNLLAGW